MFGCCLPRLTTTRISEQGCAFENNSSQRVFECFRNDKALVKMLYNCEHAHRWNDEDLSGRLKRELSELINNDFVKASSMSLLIENIPSSVFRDIGFIVDIDNCKIRELFREDARSIPIDMRGREVQWNIKCNRYCVIDSNAKKNDEDSDFQGHYKIGPRAHDRKVSSIAELKSTISKRYNENSSMLNHNEVIVDYSIKSIIGLVITKK